LDLATDSEIIKSSKNIVEKLLEKDPTLSLMDNQVIKNYYLKNYKGKNKWSKIS
jgi:ATP-dependent DNA helicase RecG